ncbi:hypothetical protein GUITHDRAFT_153153 [Guillardia theta CCMP2712]|uniref:Nuclear cap-binding protein subunit 2 n=1 Tax=Guillardia theta (strain CCMP2712) TaxID=905079 RepID=L1J5W1_GUITC|nr:hypothetical protein GUITHDRAFT_153153 [Guillardia theta CCMP2712]EKX43717.1 hypothetical protein GUITHDRAFT_153153 [Guillardia theta CCMP2712]|eukprot:XP_005830697.1 hypothetical protein GUITHDRAFT_153153 [Guillardia theta CCMP2712]
MADLYCQYERTPYFDRHSGMTYEEYHQAIEKSTCLYIGNLSYFTTEAQIYEFFSRCGEVKRVIMGLDRFQKTPCGFCFVEYYTEEDTEASIRYLNGLKLDDRPIRLDRDPGFVEGRQYGRGKSGGQVRDEYRLDFDLGRGGFGRVCQVAGAVDIEAAQSASRRSGGIYASGGVSSRNEELDKRFKNRDLTRDRDEDDKSGRKRNRESGDENDEEARARRRRGRGEDSDSD